MLDFHLDTFEQLVQSIQNNGYRIQTYNSFLSEPKSKTVILRHDVDRNPQNALPMQFLPY